MPTIVPILPQQRMTSVLSRVPRAGSPGMLRNIPRTETSGTSGRHEYRQTEVHSCFGGQNHETLYWLAHFALSRQRQLRRFASRRSGRSRWVPTLESEQKLETLEAESTCLLRSARNIWESTSNRCPLDEERQSILVGTRKPVVRAQLALVDPQIAGVVERIRCLSPRFTARKLSIDRAVQHLRAFGPACG